MPSLTRLTALCLLVALSLGSATYWALAQAPDEPPPPNARATETSDADAEEATPAEEGAADTAPPTLTEEQINLIRVYEIDLEERPTVRVPTATIDRFFEEYGDHPDVPNDHNQRRAIRRAPGYEQLGLLFDARARDLYGDARVARDPRALREFRSQIHRQYVLNYCASNQCHGGQDAPGDFRLIRRHANSDRTFYTNFYILDQYVNDQGRMIDRENPGRSLLLQYGVARDLVANPHPEVRGWRPRFHETDDAPLQDYARAIDGLWEERADYGFDFPLPYANGDDGGDEATAETEPDEAGMENEASDSPTPAAGDEDDEPGHWLGDDVIDLDE